MKGEYLYKASDIRVIDGDTIEATLDIGFKISMRKYVRIFGVNTPEINTPEGVEAKEYLQGVIDSSDNILIRTLKDKDGKYGRLLGILFVDHKNINKNLLEGGYAEKYYWEEIVEMELK